MLDYPFFLFIIGLLLNIVICTNTNHKHGNLPMVQLLGVQKGGSSSLYEFLIGHPKICGGVHKEPHFFDHVMQFNSTRSRLDYMQLYPNVPKCAKYSDSMYVDGTTIMFRINKVAKKMVELYTPEEKEKLKFIVLLREPVARDYSWYQQVMRDRLLAGTKFEEIDTLMEIDRKGLSEAITHIHRAGRYVEQLSEFLQYFQRDQILVLASDAIFKNSSKLMDSVAGFLGVEKPILWNGPFPHDDHLNGNVKFAGIAECIAEHTPKLDCKFKEELMKYYEPYNGQLYKWLKDTKVNRSKWEPDFIPFKESSASCVDNSRSNYNQLIASDTKRKVCIEQERMLI